MAVSKCFGDKSSTQVKSKRKERLPFGLKFSHAVGHIYNDLTANAWFSYLIIFLTRVAGLSNAYAGLVILIGQIADAICTPFSGFLNDRTVNRYGRRKTWHLIGTVCSTVAFPLLFSRCIGCSDSSELVKLAYYSICGCILQFGFGCVQVSHLSLIPEISKSASERVELNAISRLFAHGLTKEKIKKKERLPVTQRVCYSVGHVLNDLAGNAWFSYLLVFLTKVAGLPNAHAGYVLLISQVFEGVCTPVAGVMCDKTVCKYGRRKSWHLLGTACVTISFPFILNRCLGCTESSNAVKFFYYTGFSMVFGFGWGSTQIGHLSLIPEISKRESERVELNALRSALTFICGMYVYGVTWILLGQSNEQTLSPNVWKQFMYLGFILVGTGTLFNIIFHVGTKEPPSEALLKKQQEREVKRLGNRTNERKALLKVDCAPSPSGRRSSPQCVTTSVCDSSQTPSSCSEELSSSAVSSIESTLEKNETEIIDRSVGHGSHRTWKDWLKDPAFYKTGLVYTCSRLVVNVSQSYLPLYLTETLKFEKEAIAYFPLVVLISGVFASGTVKPLNKRLGSKITFSLGCMLAMSACFWFYVQDAQGRNAIYATAIIMGCGGSVMLVTSLSLIAEMIGHDKKSGAFVYGTISFTDKLSSGVIIAIIQEMNPRTNMTTDCPSCDEFVRNVQSFAPGLAALVALVSILLFFDSIFACKRKVTKADIAVQTDFEEVLKEKDSLDFAGSCEEVEEDDSDKSLDCDVEKNSSKITVVYGIPRSMDNYAACRLATPYMPSPLLDRRTIV